MTTSDIISNQEIGARIKERRKAVGMTQEQLAFQLNVSYQQVQRYENGMNRLNVETIQQIAHILRVPVIWFFQRDYSGGVVESSELYISNEEAKLCFHYNQINSKKNRQTVMDVARMASQLKEDVS